MGRVALDGESYAFVTVLLIKFDNLNVPAKTSKTGIIFMLELINKTNNSIELD